MVAKRIIPCLDVKDGRTVKGVRFTGLTDVGDAVELGRFYALNGADELVYLDISASGEERTTFTRLVERIADGINIPFTVGGGIATPDDAARLLDAGADKITVNSAANRTPAVTAASSSLWPSMPDATSKAHGTPSLTAELVPPTGNCWPGPPKQRSAAPARFSSPRWTTTEHAEVTPAPPMPGCPNVCTSPS